MPGESSTAKTIASKLSEGLSLKLDDDKISALSAEAGPLKRILMSPPVRTAWDRYQFFGKQAGTLQTSYRRQVNLLSGAFIAVVFLALLVLLFDFGGEIDRALKTLAYFTSLLAIVGFFAAWFLVDRLKLHSNWYATRMEAEQQRAEIFDLVVKANERSAQGELPVPDLKLAFVEAGHLDLQSRYYRYSVDKLKNRIKGVGRAGWLGRIVLGFAILSIVLLLLSVASEHYPLWAPVQHFTSVIQGPIDLLRIDNLLLVTGLLLLLWALRRFVLNLMDESDRNARLYAKAADSLDALKQDDLGMAQGALTTPHAEEAIQIFRRKLQTILDAERKVWELAVDAREAKRKGTAIPAPAKP